MREWLTSAAKRHHSCRVKAVGTHRDWMTSGDVESVPPRWLTSQPFAIAGPAQSTAPATHHKASCACHARESLTPAPYHAQDDCAFSLEVQMRQACRHQNAAAQLVMKKVEAESAKARCCGPRAAPRCTGRGLPTSRRAASSSTIVRACAEAIRMSSACRHSKAG